MIDDGPGLVLLLVWSSRKRGDAVAYIRNVGYGTVRHGTGFAKTGQG